MSQTAASLASRKNAASKRVQSIRRLIHRKSRRLNYLALSAALFLSCALYHLQTPETVPVGKSAVGLGAFGWYDKSADRPSPDSPLLGFPGAWIRTGIAPKMDLGFHLWFLGLKADIKYGLNRYLGFGAGLGFGYLTFFGGDQYPAVAEASLYTGIPLEPLYPYVIGRVTCLPEPYYYPNVNIDMSAVAGVRLRTSPSLAFYAESGTGSIWGSRHWIVALGMEIRP